jgi:hypothetical protein
VDALPGHDPGQLDWRHYVAHLVGEHGSVAAVAEHIADHRGHTEALDTIERGIRRLRARGHRDGGAWGRRLLAQFGLPAAIEVRARWMGSYHSRFTDLPTPLCHELLQPWDRPPLSASRVRVWVQLGLASVALRGRRTEDASRYLQQATLAAARATDHARCELALVNAYAISRDQPDAAAALLTRAGDLLDRALTHDDRACLFARWIDQRAYPLNRGAAPDHEAALALYEQIDGDGPPFALVRRHNGLAWTHLRLGHRDTAVTHARAALRHAGDGGSLRLRAMALKALAAAVGGDEANRARARARAIAERLDDQELRLRMR